MTIINDILDLSNSWAGYFDLDDDGGPRFDVRDSGVVITEEDFERMLSLFRLADRTTRRIISAFVCGSLWSLH